MPLLDVFEGRTQLLAYFHMWHDGKPAPEQCEGCTFFTGHAQELSYLHSRDVTYATFCQGTYDGERAVPGLHGLGDAVVLGARLGDAILPGRSFGFYACYLRDGDRVFETYWNTGRGAEAGANSYHLLDLTVYGSQETWEDSPEGWPQPYDPSAGAQFRTGERPTSQWARIGRGPLRRPVGVVTPERRLIGFWPLVQSGSPQTPGLMRKLTAPTRVAGSNEYIRSAGPVLPSAHIRPFGTSVRSTVQGPPATRVICSSNPVDVEIVPPHVTSGLHCVVMVHVFVVAPLMNL